MAVVFAGPDTTVDGTVVIDRMGAYPEELVETHSANAATMLVTGTVIQVLGNSRVRYHGTSAELLSGEVSVSTVTRFLVMSECFAAQPGPIGNTRYSITTYDSKLYLAAQQGELLVKAGKEMRVPAGRVLAISSCGKPSELMQFVSAGDLRYKAAFGATAAAAGASAIIIRPLSSEKPTVQ